MHISTSGGLIDVGETIFFHIENDLPDPKTLTIYERYLEKNCTAKCSLPILWEKTQTGFEATLFYTPHIPGNYYAELGEGIYQRTAYFGVWAPGIAVQTMWMFFSSAWHARGNLHDFYGTEFQRYHLPADIEICTTGDEFLSTNWFAIENLKKYHLTNSCKIYPFLDFAIAETFLPHLKGQRGGRQFGPLPNPTAHGLNISDCREFIIAIQEHWKRWNLPAFEMVGHYSPNNALVEACGLEGLLGIDGVFSEHDFNDGGNRWDYGWRQYHFGLSNFPYYARETDFRKAGCRDERQSPVMIFPADLRHPVLSHAGYTGHSNDMGFNYWIERNPISGGPSTNVHHVLDKYIEFQEEMYASIAANNSLTPTVLCGPVEFGDDECPGVIDGNRMLLQYFANRGRSGQVIFAHKSDVAKYYKRHLVTTPDQGYVVHDLISNLKAPEIAMHVMTSDHGYDQFARNEGKPEIFPDTLVWCGSNGKAVFLQREILNEPAQNVEIAPKKVVSIRPSHRGSPWLPFWWYDYNADGQNMPETSQMEMVDLEGFSAKLERLPDSDILSLLIDAPRHITNLPVCLWGYKIPSAGQVVYDGPNGYPATIIYLDVHKGARNSFEWEIS